jgi:hypothetical protein
VLMSEKELSVQVTEIDGVQVDDMDLAVAGEDEVLEQFATYATCANEQNARLTQL